LWHLYTDTSTQLAIGKAGDATGQDHAALAVAMAGRPDDISEAELGRFVTSLPRAYLSVFGLATIYGHVRLARGILPHEVHATFEQHGAVCELTVVTLDKPFLFSHISGVLSYFGMDIHRGQAMTTPSGLVLDVFEFSDEEQFLGQNPAGAAEIHKILQTVVAGALDVTTLLRGKTRSVLYKRRARFAPTVHFDNEHSQKFTVLEIVADDALGLLHRISRTIARHGCDLHLALISTEGKKAIDVLHVTKRKEKLSEADQAALKQELEGMLEGVHETD
jgi:[protein-PII] uridylyltransferase